MLFTIYENDQLLQQLTQILNDYGTWSVMYFSDHGLVHKELDNKWTMIHSPGIDNNGNYAPRQAYHVPMLKLSSDDNEHKIIKANKSGFNFIYAFSEWLDIHEQHLNHFQQLF